MKLLKKRVKNTGITQTKLAEIGKVSNTHISYILEGKRQISYSLAKKIYKELGYYSPLSVILEYYGFEAKGDDLFKRFTEDKPITETVAKVITTHFKNNDLSRKEKGAFLGTVLGTAGVLVDKDKSELFESFTEAYKWEIEEPEGVK